MNMELIGITNNTERTESDRRKTAEEIHAAISYSLSQLLDRDGMPEGHSSVVELREHQAIAARALGHFSTEDSLVRAA